MLPGETVHSPLPQDIPWWSPDFAVFFGVLYLVLLFIGSGVGYGKRGVEKGRPARVLTMPIRRIERDIFSILKSAGLQ